MRPTKFSTFKFTSQNKADLQTMSKVLGINETPLEITVTIKWVEGDHASKRDRYAILVSNPPKTVN